MKCVADELRNSVRAIDLRDPLGHLSEHAPVIHLLERFALDHVAADLADEQNHRSRILIGGMHTDACIGRARTPCDEANARSAGELAVGFRHKRRATFLPAYDQPHAFAHIVIRIQHIEITLAWNAKRSICPMNSKLVNQNAPAASERHVFVHSCSPVIRRSIIPMLGFWPSLAGQGFARAVWI